MEAKVLYDRLDEDFKLAEARDDWNEMDFNEYICENFKKRQLGLVLDNSKEVKRVYTAVFPSDKVLNELLNKGVTDVLLVTHHPMVWDIRKAPKVFADISKNLLKKLKKNRISLYTLHVPLDWFGEYSTGVTFTKALGMKVKEEFLDYYGHNAGIIAKTSIKTVMDLKKKFSSVLSHRVKLYKYGTSVVVKGRVGVVAGGGNMKETHEELNKKGVNVLITGISVLNEHSRKVHELAEKYKINIIGGTHYSTEKFACIELCKYFNKLGLDCEFIPEEPVMEDM